jgi:hypothetical protein
MTMTSIVKLSIKFVCGKAKLGGLAMIVSDNITRFATMEEAVRISKWCREQGHGVEVTLLEPCTFEEVKTDIADHIASGAWKPDHRQKIED